MKNENRRSMYIWTTTVWLLRGYGCSTTINKPKYHQPRCRCYIADFKHRRSKIGRLFLAQSFENITSATRGWENSSSMENSDGLQTQQIHVTRCESKQSKSFRIKVTMLTYLITDQCLQLMCVHTENCVKRTVRSGRIPARNNKPENRLDLILIAEYLMRPANFGNYPSIHASMGSWSISTYCTAGRRRP